MFQTDSDEDVVFVSERSCHKPIEITIDQAKRLALQREIDQQSRPKETAKPLSSKRLVAEERHAEIMKMKMEEETSGENNIKKEKKYKKGKADDGSLAEVKKDQNKGKIADAVVIEERFGDGNGKKEKRKKRKTDSLDGVSSSKVTDGKDVTKKKKKRLLADGEAQGEITQSLVKEEEVEKKQRKTKGKNKSTQVQQENMVKEEEEQVGKDNLPKKVKKGKKQILDLSTEETEEKIKEKKKKTKLLADGEPLVETAKTLVKEEEVEKKQRKKTYLLKNKSTQIKQENMVKEEEEEKLVGKDNLPKKVKEKQHALDMSTEATEGKRKEKKKKTKCPLTVEGATIKKAKVAENGIKLEKTEYEDVKLKKKEKKETETKEENGVETTEIKGKNKKRKAASDKVIKSEKQEKSTNSVIVTTDDEVTAEFKIKVKKGKCKTATVEATSTEEEEPKKKKRKKVKREEEDEKREVQEDEQGGEAGDTPKEKSKKKRSSANVERKNDSGVEPAAKKKKRIKQEREDPEFQGSPQVDVVFLSERSGNTDEITINQERRQALQMEIDKASQPDKTVKPTGVGQWSTAQFNSSEQQQKFLRLMGGFKKGFQPAMTSTGGANMALGKDAQQQLQQGLLGEFERAHSRRMDFNNRGAGLGFTAPSNKKFSIDINTCRSVRFDD